MNLKICLQRQAGVSLYRVMEKGGVLQNLTTIKKALRLLISAVFKMQLFHALSLDREKTKAETMYSLIWSIYCPKLHFSSSLVYFVLV